MLKIFTGEFSAANLAMTSKLPLVPALLGIVLSVSAYGQESSQPPAEVAGQGILQQYDPAKRWLVKLLGTKRMRETSTLAGTWHYSWGVDKGPQTGGTVTLSQVGKNLAGEFDYQHANGLSTYRLLAVRVTDEWISGRYEDVISGYTFHVFSSSMSKLAAGGWR